MVSTGKGDKGKTSNFSKKGMWKDCCQIKALGSVDELNSQIGNILTYNISEISATILKNTQKTLFKLGADLSTPPFTKQKRIDDEDINYLNKQIKKLQENLPKLTKFVLPGGCRSSANLHIARTVCRRAEREVVEYSRESSINPKIIKYINKLSDILFLLALQENKKKEKKEELVGLDENLHPFLD